MENYKPQTGGGRIEFVDTLKGIAIILVAYMHCLEASKGQYFGEPGIMNDKLFAFVLSFHMPVFMMVSGFFSKSILSTNVYTLVRRRIIPILIPLIIWTGLSAIWHPTWQSNLLWGEYWFLNCILVIYGLFFLARIVPERFQELFIILLCVVTMCMSQFTYCHVNSMFPFFCIGYFLKTYFSFFTKYSKSICIFSGLVFLFLSLFWSIDWTCYQLQIDLLHNTRLEIFHIMYRIVIGTSGALFLFSLLNLTHEYYKKSHIVNIVNWLGRYTLAVYLIHYFFYWIYALPKGATGNLLLDDFVITPLYTIVVLAVSYLIIKLIKCNKYLSYLVIGEKI